MIEKLKIFDESKVEQFLRKENQFDDRRDTYVQLEEFMINKMFNKAMDKKNRRNKMLKMLNDMKNSK